MLSFHHFSSFVFHFSFFFFLMIPRSPLFSFFFFNDPAPTEIYPLPLHAALPIFPCCGGSVSPPSPSPSPRRPAIAIDDDDASGATANPSATRPAACDHGSAQPPSPARTGHRPNPASSSRRDDRFGTFPYARANSAASIDPRSPRTASSATVRRHLPQPHRHGGAGHNAGMNPKYDSSSSGSQPSGAEYSKKAIPRPESAATAARPDSIFSSRTSDVSLPAVEHTSS